jgi:hypothetical protein
VNKCKWIAVVAIVTFAALTSCRKSPSTPKITGEQQPNTVQKKPQIVRKADVEQAEPARVLSEDEQSCKAFVQDFYDWYVSREVTDECNQEEKMQEKMHKVFADSINTCKRASEFHSVKVMSLKQSLNPKLKKLLDEDAAAQAKETDGIVGLDGDPFLNGNAGVIYNYIADDAHVADGKCTATVNETGINGNQEEEGKIYDHIALDLSKSSEKWMIDNIHYRITYFDQTKKAEVTSDEDLIHELNGLGDK